MFDLTSDRRRSLARVALFCAFATMGQPPAPAAAQVALDPSSVLRSGTEVAAPLAGFEFTVPEGFQGEWDAEVGGFGLQSAQGLLAGIWGWSQGEVGEVAGAIEAMLAEGGLRLSPRGDVEFSEERLQGTYDAWLEGSRGILKATILRGEYGNVFAVAVLGAGEQEGDIVAARDAVVASLQVARPGAADWRRDVEGTVLTWSSSGSDMSTGTTTATGASQSQATLSLCGGEAYRYEESSESYVSIEGMSASNSSSDGHTGQWWISADLAGRAILTLDATDGRYFYWIVEDEGESYLIDGYRYRVTGGC